eukprot:2146701-Prymnesium_polylepis.1
MWAGFEEGPAGYPYRRLSSFAQHAHTPLPTPYPSRSSYSHLRRAPPRASLTDAGPVCPLGGGRSSRHPVRRDPKGQGEIPGAL